MIATSLSVIPFTTPHEATAADTDSCAEGCTAYVWNGDSVVPLKAENGTTPKFTKLGIMGSDNEFLVATLRDTSNSIWTVAHTEGSDQIRLVKKSGWGLGTYGNNHLKYNDTPEVPSTLAGHAARGFSTGTGEFIGTIDGDGPRIYTGSTDSSIDNRLSIDAKGRLWSSAAFCANNDNCGYQSPTVVQDSDEIEFMDIAKTYDINPFGVVNSTILLGKPRVQTPQTVINQMPTTGAPDGLSSVGLLAVGVGLLGMTVVLVRRRQV